MIIIFKKSEDMRFEVSPRDPHQRVSVPKNVILSEFKN